MTSTAIISFLVCMAIVAIISWYKTRKEKLNTTTGFFLANRNNGFIIVGGSLLLANISANQFIGENESVYTNNMTVMAWGVTSVLAMLIVSEFFMPVYFRSAIITTPDFLEERYDSATKRIVSIIFLISYIVNLMPPVLYGGAVAFNGIFHISEVLDIGYWEMIWLLVWAIGIIGTLYTILGGLKAIAVSDTVLWIGMLLGGIMVPWFGFKYLGNGSVGNGINIVLGSEKQHLDAIGTSADPFPFSTFFTGMVLSNLYFWGMEQFIVQQALAAKNLAASQKGIALACIGKLLSPLLLNVPGLIAVHMYMDMNNTAEVFPRMVGDVLPPALTGFTAAIIFGAALTTFNAGLNSSSTLFVLNLYKPFKERRKQPVSEKQLVRVGKKFEVMIALFAMFTAPFIIFFKGGFYVYIQKVAGFFSIPIFTILFVGFITKKVPPVAAKVGLLFFITVYAFTQMVFDTGIHFLHMLAILFVLTTAIMLLIGKFFPLETPYKQIYKPLTDVTPWKHRHWAAAILLLFMIVLFIIFSPLVLAE